MNRETVRYYEQRGLIPEPPRTDGDYRTYDESYVERIRFIKRAQELGFSLKEIGELLALRLDPDGDCGDVRAKATAKLEDVHEKIRARVLGDCLQWGRAHEHLPDSGCAGRRGGLRGCNKIGRRNARVC